MSQAIRVLHVLGGLDIGGAETFVMNVYRALDRTAIQFDFVKHTNKNQFFDNEIRQLGGKIFSCPRYNVVNHFEYCKWWKKFFATHTEYCIIHGHVRSTASLYMPIAKKYGLKTIIHSHSTSNGTGISAFVKTVLQYPIRYQADYFFACSDAAGEWLFGKKIMKGGRYYKIQNAVDIETSRLNLEVRKKYREELKLEDKIVYAHVGRLHESKNHMFLIEVFSELLAVQPNAVLLIVGDGDLREQIEKKVDELQMGRAIKMLGSRDDVSNILQASDCFLFPSKWEGLPVTVVEAQAAGLPCFVSDRVTREVGVSELVNYLPIDKGTKLWVDAIRRQDCTRRDVTEKIRAAGFDVRTLAKWMKDFYGSLWRDE
ncbi:MAG: glycosyltransferase family 1 protein [Lachnospiraceae bacterium]|nr:glycosyltransferase family 1 protein [Lachnospiraceae bacterium]